MTRHCILLVMIAMCVASPTSVVAMGAFDPTLLQQMTQTDTTSQDALQQQLAQQAQAQQQQRWLQLQDQQSTISTIQQDVTVNKAQTSMEINPWAQYLMQ